MEHFCDPQYPIYINSTNYFIVSSKLPMYGIIVLFLTYLKLTSLISLMIIICSLTSMVVKRHIFLLCVDDIIIMTSSTSLRQYIIQMLSFELTIKDLGP